MALRLGNVETTLLVQRQGRDDTQLGLRGGTAQAGTAVHAGTCHRGDDALRVHPADPEVSVVGDVDAAVGSSRQGARRIQAGTGRRAAVAGKAHFTRAREGQDDAPGRCRRDRIQSNQPDPVAGAHEKRTRVIRIVRDQRRRRIQRCRRSRSAVARITRRAIAREGTHDALVVHHPEPMRRGVGEENQHPVLGRRQLCDAPGHADDGVRDGSAVSCKSWGARSGKRTDCLRVYGPDARPIGNHGPPVQGVDGGRSLEVGLKPRHFRSDRTGSACTGAGADGLRCTHRGRQHRQREEKHGAQTRPETAHGISQCDCFRWGRRLAIVRGEATGGRRKPWQFTAQDCVFPGPQQLSAVAAVARACPDRHVSGNDTESS